MSKRAVVGGPVSWVMMMALAGCGGSSGAIRGTSTSTTASAASAQHSEQAGEASVMDLDPTSPGSSIPELPELRLGARVDVPGTGVSMRVPEGWARLRFGTGFTDGDGRFEILVAVASGTEDRLNAFARSVSADAREIESEDATIAGHPARLVVDTQTDGDREVERTWTFVRDGSHAIAVVGVYAPNAAPRLRDVVRASVLSTEWNPNAAIEPERAAGFGLAAPPGLMPDPQVVSGLMYVQPGSEIQPASGRPTLILLSLPAGVPPAARHEDCEVLLLAMGPVYAEAVVSSAEIATDTLQGCELFGSEPVPSGEWMHELATYGALVFLGDRAFLVGGFVDAAERDDWEPRFSAAARSVHEVAR